MRRHYFMPSASIMTAVVVVLLLSAASSSSASAAEPTATKELKDKDKDKDKAANTPKPSDKDKDGDDAEMPSERTSLSVAATPALPLGHFSDAFVLGLGGSVGLDHAVHPHVQIIGRTGYVHHLPKADFDMTLGALPIWGGARYTFGVNKGGYVEGALGPTILFSRMSFGDESLSDTDVKIGMSLGGGYRVGKLDAGARMVFWDIGHAGESVALMATVGFEFASF